MVRDFVLKKEESRILPSAFAASTSAFSSWSKSPCPSSLGNDSPNLGPLEKLHLVLSFCFLSDSDRGLIP